MTSLINIYADFKPNRIIVGKLYPAEVVDNNDLKNHKDKTALGRIRFRIPTLFEGIEDDLLPWAVPNFARWKGGKNNGTFSVPAKKTLVLIRFQTPDVYNPIYQPYPYTIKEQLELLTVDEVDKEEYPKKHLIYSFDSKNFMWTNADYADPELKDKTFLRNTGNVQFWFGRNFDGRVKKNYRQKVEDKFTLSVTSEVYHLEVEVPHVQILKRDSTRTFEGKEVKEVQGKSFHNYYDRAGRQYANGLLEVIGNNRSNRIDGNLDIHCTGMIRLVGDRGVQVCGSEVALDADENVVLNAGDKVLASSEPVVGASGGFADEIRNAVRAEIEAYMSGAGSTPPAKPQDEEFGKDSNAAVDKISSSS